MAPEEITQEKVMDIEPDQWKDLDQKEVLEHIQELIDSANDSGLQEFIKNSHPADLAEVLEDLNDEDYAIYLFRLCEETLQAQIIVELDEDLQSSIMETLNLKEISNIVENLESDDITYLVSEVNTEKAEQILNTIDSAESSKIRDQLKFEESSAGRLMSNEFAAVYEEDTVKRGIVNLRKVASGDTNIYLLYVLDTNGIAKGYVTLKDLFFSDTRMKIKEIMKTTLKTVHHSMDQEEVAKFFKKYDYVSAAVVDDEGKMIGRITVDDVLDIVDEEATEDFMRIGGVSEDEKLNQSLLESVKSRITWLHINLLTAVLASWVVTFFESTIDKIVVLASLMPIVAGMGGNAGTQSITVIVRNIATGEIDDKNWRYAIFKEARIGAINGVILGIVTAVLVLIFKKNIYLALVIGAAMLVNMTIAGLVGSSVPILLKFFKIDPAIASSIFVTTCTDIFGFFCFLGLATVFIEYLL
jgi:magnesium transporter